MSSSRNASEPSSAASTPRSEHHPPPHRWHHLYNDGAGGEEPTGYGPRVRLMCSFGGRILPRPHDHQLRYAGGETRIVAVPRSASFAALLAKLAKLCGPAGGDDVQVKYQLPHEDLDALISVTSDEDVEIMMEEHDRLATIGGGAAARTPRIRLFLFSSGGDLGSLHGSDDDGGSRRDRWFLDALNGGAAAALEMGRSEVSSVVSEVPDYLCSLDGYSDERDPKLPNVVGSASDFHESPAHADRFEPTGSADIPPPPPEINPTKDPVQPTAMAGYSASQTWHYPEEPVPVYFVPTSLPPHQTGPVPVPIPLHMPYGLPNHGPVPVVYQHVAQGFNANPIHAPVYVGGSPMVQPGLVGSYSLPTSIPPQGYSLPPIADRAPYGMSSLGGVIPVNPVTGIPYSDEFPQAVGKGEKNCL